MSELSKPTVKISDGNMLLCDASRDRLAGIHDSNGRCIYLMHQWYTADELRAIADKLDELDRINKEGAGK